MSYVSKGEKVFKAQDKKNPDCDTPKPKRSDHRLKRFYSTFDQRAWNLSDVERYRHLYDLISGSQTCLVLDDFHRIVPVEDLVNILLAEKDAYIRELEEKLKARRGGQPPKEKREVGSNDPNNSKGRGKLKNKGKIPVENNNRPEQIKATKTKPSQFKPETEASDFKTEQGFPDQVEPQNGSYKESPSQEVLSESPEFDEVRTEHSGPEETKSRGTREETRPKDTREETRFKETRRGESESEEIGSRELPELEEAAARTIEPLSSGNNQLELGKESPEQIGIKEVREKNIGSEKGSSKQINPEQHGPDLIAPEQVRLNQQNLTEELNNSREMLRLAMHKLQNIDEIVNENKKLQKRLRCSEEKIKFLEEKKKRLELELADLRSKSQIQIDLEKAQERLILANDERNGISEADEIALRQSSLEQDELRKKVEKLEKELEESKKKENELQMIKNQSLSTDLDVEEMWKENECYKKKLASMKNLEEQIQELKKQGRCLADKYKRESQRAAEQMKKMNQAAKELRCLRDERDDLRRRVDELSSLEPQYKALQHKLKCVEEVIEENDMLNSKLMALDELEKENEYLRCKLGQIEEMEMSAAEDKERILQLQCAVADQEEEMQNLLSQIQKLTSGNEDEELERLKCELFDRDSKLRLCEEQLAEIPMLEAEIDELRTKLQSCCKEYSEKKTYENRHQRIEIRFPAPSKEISAKYKNEEPRPCSVLGTRREEKIGSKKLPGVLQKIFYPDQESTEASSNVPTTYDNGETMSCDEVQNLLQSSKDIITCVLEDMIEHQKEMEELEKCNREMKEEIQILKRKIGSAETSDPEKGHERKNLGVSPLKENEVEALKDLNEQMKKELEAAYEDLKKMGNLEESLTSERKARDRAESLLRLSSRIEPLGFRPVEEGTAPDGDATLDRCQALQKEIDDLKFEILNLKKLTEELKKENELLRELQQPCPDFSKELDEKCALENLLSLLQAELDAFKGQKLTDECEALRVELKRIMEQNCQLKALVSCYRQRLELEKKSTALKEEKIIPAEDEEKKSELADEEKKSELADEEKKSELAGEGVLLMKPQESSSELEDKEIPKEDSEQIIFMDDLGQKLSEEKSNEDDITRSSEEQKKSTPNISLEEVKSVKTVPSEEPKKESISKDFEKEGKAILEKSPEEESRKKSIPEASEKKKKDEKPPTDTEEKKEKDDISTVSEKEQKKESVSVPDKQEKKEEIPITPEKEKEKENISTAPEKEEKKESAPLVPDEKQEKDPAEGTKKESFPKIPDQERKKDKKEEEKEKTSSIGRSSEESEKRPSIAKRKEEKQNGEGTLKNEELPKEPIQKPTRPLEDESKSAKPLPTNQATPDKTKPPETTAAEPKTIKKKSEDKDEEIKKGEMERENLLKQVEKLKKENKELAAQLAESSGKEKPPKVLEADLEERLKNMEMENAEKLRKLNEQHEKELADRDKMYKDNLNAIKSGYESDIRKMADRHKQSILRLQNLHEDEIRELSTHHENQMETMQTQSEVAINDVARGSAAKIQKLSQQYEKDLKSVEGKLQNDFRDKESKYLEEINGLRKSLTKCREELNLQRKKLEDETKATTSALKGTNDREIQKVRKSNMKKQSLLKSNQDGLQNKEKKDVGIQTETSNKFKEQTQGDGICECKFGKRKCKVPRDPTSPLYFNEVLEKILEQGLDSLTFNEIALVHRKTCCALEGIVMNSNVSPVLEPPVGDGCVHLPLLQEDKQQLMTRIIALENEIVSKQKQNQDDIINMEVAVKKERCRIQELKNILQSEQEKNLQLKSLLTSQTKLQSDLRKERDSLGNQASLHHTLCLEKLKELDQEKKDKKYLEEEVERLKFKVNQLYVALISARETAECKQKKDVEQIQMMRLKLEQSTNQEHKLAVELENEARCRMQPQYQLQALRHSFNQMVDLPAVEKEMKFSHLSSESKSAKEKQNLDQVKDKKIKKQSKKLKR